MKELENLKELYLEEIRKITKKGELSPAEHDAASKALDNLEKINMLCEMDDNMHYDKDRSERYYPMNRSYSHMPDMMDHDSRYDRRYSSARGTRRGMHYSSREDTVSNMIAKLERMRDDTYDDRHRMVIDRCIDELESY